MGRIFRQYLSGPRIYSCNTCHCHSADAEDVESKVACAPALCSVVMCDSWHTALRKPSTWGTSGKDTRW